MSCLFFFLGKPNDDSDDESEQQERARAGSAPPPKSDDAPGGTNCGSVEWKEDEWREKTVEIWQRDIKTLPAHTDIPRLGTKMRIFDAQGNLAMEDIPDDLPRHDMVQRLLAALAAALKDDASLDVIQTKYGEVIDISGKGDISQQLLRFFVDHLPADGRTIKVLKACHQKIVFPGFYHVKSKLFDRMPFKDQRGTWSMSIYLIDNHIEIRHRKAQVSQFKKPDVSDQGDDISFEWELRMRFDENMENMEDVQVAVVSINFRDDVDAQRRTELTDLIRTHFPENA